MGKIESISLGTYLEKLSKSKKVSCYPTRSKIGCKHTYSGEPFILLEVTPKARQPLFFWRLLLKPGSP